MKESPHAISGAPDSAVAAAKSAGLDGLAIQGFKGKSDFPVIPFCERAAIDWWAKDAAPSPDLRRAWHAADADAWDACADAYREELAGPSAVALAALRREVAQHPVVTLLFAVHDPLRTHAVVLREALEA